MMGSTNVPGDMVKFLRTSWETYLKILETVQFQSEKVIEIMLSQSNSFQSEGKEMLKQWLEMMRQSQEQYKKMMEDNLSKLESMSKE